MGTASVSPAGGPKEKTVTNENANQHEPPPNEEGGSRSGSPSGYPHLDDCDCEECDERNGVPQFHPGFVKEIIDGMRSMSGLCLWHVTGTWTNKGRTGTIDDVVEAKTATEAIAIAWEPEDDRDLRTISATWMTPIECVKRRDVSG